MHNQHTRKSLEEPGSSDKRTPHRIIHALLVPISQNTLLAIAQSLANIITFSHCMLLPSRAPAPVASGATRTKKCLHKVSTYYDIAK